MHSCFRKKNVQKSLEAYTAMLRPRINKCKYKVIEIFGLYGFQDKWKKKKKRKKNARAVFNWESKVICVCFGFALLHSVIGQQNSRHFFNQWQAKPILFTISTRTFALVFLRHTIENRSIFRKWFLISNQEKNIAAYNFFTYAAVQF